MKAPKIRILDEQNMSGYKVCINVNHKLVMEYEVDDLRFAYKSMKSLVRQYIKSEPVYTQIRGSIRNMDDLDCVVRFSHRERRALKGLPANIFWKNRSDKRNYFRFCRRIKSMRTKEFAEMKRVLNNCTSREEQEAYVEYIGYCGWILLNLTPRQNNIWINLLESLNLKRGETDEHGNRYIEYDNGLKQYWHKTTPMSL